MTTAPDDKTAVRLDGKWFKAILTNDPNRDDVTLVKIGGVIAGEFWKSLATFTFSVQPYRFRNGYQRTGYVSTIDNEEKCITAIVREFQRQVLISDTLQKRVKS